MIFNIVVGILIVLALLWLWPLIKVAIGFIFLIAILGFVVFLIGYAILNPEDEASIVIFIVAIAIGALVTFSRVRMKIEELGSFGNAIAYFHAWVSPAFGDEAMLRKIKRFEVFRIEAKRIEESKAKFANKLKKEHLNQLEGRIASGLSRYYKEAAIFHKRSDYEGSISIWVSIPYEKKLAVVFVCCTPITESSATCVTMYLDADRYEQEGIKLSDARGIKFLKKRIIKHLQEHPAAINPVS